VLLVIEANSLSWVCRVELGAMTRSSLHTFYTNWLCFRLLACLPAVIPRRRCSTSAVLVQLPSESFNDPKSGLGLGGQRRRVCSEDIIRMNRLGSFELATQEILRRTDSRADSCHTVSSRGAAGLEVRRFSARNKNFSGAERMHQWQTSRCGRGRRAK
jgi:hypothetical protein